MIDFEAIKPTGKMHLNSDTDYMIYKHGCIFIWNCDTHEAIRLSLHELHDLHQTVFPEA